LFPEFAAYAARVPQLMPRMPERLPEERFDWSVYMQNKEQKALYGFLAVYGFLVAKAIWS
jgi:hypothetical protein